MRCPICEKEQMQGPVCDNCGFDPSCDYEGRRTLCFVLPKGAEPISVRAARWKQRQKPPVTEPQRTLICPKCGGKRFFVLIDAPQFQCSDCGVKIPAAVQKDGPVSKNGPFAEKETADAPGGPPVINSAPKETNAAPAQVRKRIIGPTIAAGGLHTVGLRADRTVTAAGWNEDGQCGVNGWKDIVAIAAGHAHTAGLRADGTVIATGWNKDGRCDVAHWTDIVAIVCANHTVGLRSDGTVAAVGANTGGRCDVAHWTDIVAIACGLNHTVGLKADGTVVTAGENTQGQRNVGKWTGIVAIAAGYDHTVGLKADGTVIAAGCNDSSEYVERYGNYSVCDVDDWTDIVAVAAGGFHTVGLKADGTVVATGRNDFSAINDGQCDVDGWADIMAVACGYDYTVGLKSDGTIVATGINDYGQCNVGGWRDILLPDGSNAKT